MKGSNNEKKNGNTIAKKVIKKIIAHGRVCRFGQENIRPLFYSVKYIKNSRVSVQASFRVSTHIPAEQLELPSSQLCNTKCMCHFLSSL